MADTGLTATGLEIRQVAYGDPDAERLQDEVQAVYVARYGSPDPALLSPADFVEPGGAFFVGHLDGVAVATGAWRVLPLSRLGVDRVAEIKRMYVVPGMQRRGIARAMLAHLEGTAAAAGIEALVLSTGPLQQEAVALYRGAGYEPVEGFGAYACHPQAIFLGRLL